MGICISVIFVQSNNIHRTQVYICFWFLLIQTDVVLQPFGYISFTLQSRLCMCPSGLCWDLTSMGRGAMKGSGGAYLGELALLCETLQPVAVIKSFISRGISSLRRDREVRSLCPMGLSLEQALQLCSLDNQALGLVLSHICPVTTGNKRTHSKMPLKISDFYLVL